MATKVMIVHGVGNHRKGWSRKISKRWGLDASQVIEMTWNDLSDEAMRTLKIPKWKQILWRLAGNATAYPMIHSQVRRRGLALLRDRLSGDDTVILVGHSWGGYVVNDLLLAMKERGNADLLGRVRRVVTLATPLARHIAGPVAHVPQLAWHNVQSIMDFISLPLARRGAVDHFALAVPPHTGAWRTRRARHFITGAMEK